MNFKDLRKTEKLLIRNALEMYLNSDECDEDEKSRIETLLCKIKWALWDDKDS